jgi:hypothetical protein
MTPDPAWLSLAWAVPATLIHLAIVGVLLRLTAQRAALPMMALAAAVVFAAGLWLGGDRLSFWHFGAGLGFGVAAVVFIYGAVLKSLSIDLLLRLDEATDGGASLEALVEEVVRPRFAERAEIIMRTGMGERTDDGVRASPRGVASAARLTRTRAWLGVDAARLYEAPAPALSGRAMR